MIDIPEIPEDAPPRALIIGTRTWIGSNWIHIDGDLTPLSTHPTLPNVGLHPVDISCDAKSIPLPDGYAGYVFSSECLEHFSHKQYFLVLSEWCRLVTPGGYIRIEVPDALAAFQQVLEADNLDMDRRIQQIIFGGQDNEFDAHYVGITHRMLEEDFNNLGFEVLDIRRGFECGWLRADARKSI